jgi:hypothetical protein
MKIKMDKLKELQEQFETFTSMRQEIIHRAWLEVYTELCNAVVKEIVKILENKRNINL